MHTSSPLRARLSHLAQLTLLSVVVLSACDSDPLSLTDSGPAFDSSMMDAATGPDVAGYDASTGSDGAVGTDGSVSTDGAVGTDSGPLLTDAGPTRMPADCAEADIHCVDDTAGPTQEFTTIQDAVDTARPGDTVLVFDGSYAGFQLESGGELGDPTTIRAVGRVDLTSAAPDFGNVIRFQNVSYVTIDGFNIDCGGSARPYDYDLSGIAGRGAQATEPMSGITVRNTEVTGCSPGGFYCSQCQGLQLVGNYIHDNVMTTRDNGGHGVYLSNAGTDDVLAIGNRFEDNAGPGIHLNGDSSVGGDGLQSGHWFEGNTFHRNGQNGLNMDGVQAVTFVNNIFANNGNHGIRGFRIDGAEGPEDFLVVNNTFVENGGTSVKFTADGGGHVIFNNLSLGNGEGDFDISESTPQLGTNIDERSADGVLRNAAGGDYQLADGAAAIDGGSVTLDGQDAPTTDFAGDSRTGAPDIGAYEAR